MKIFQRDFGPGCNRCSCVSAQNSYRLSNRIFPQIGIGEIVFSPAISFAFSMPLPFVLPVTLPFATSLRFFRQGFDQRDRPRIRRPNCGQRHVSVKGQNALVIGYLTLNAVHIHTIDPADMIRIHKHLCHPASYTVRQCQRGREVQREAERKDTPARISSIFASLQKPPFFYQFIAGKSSTVHF
mgnify:CR=1 FL=1